MTISMTTARVRRTYWAVRNGPGRGRVQRMEWGKGMGRHWRKGRKGEGKGNSKGKDIVKQTPEGDDSSRAVAVQLQKEMYEPDSDTVG
jgi:hypothetical protein